MEDIGYKKINIFGLDFNGSTFEEIMEKAQEHFQDNITDIPVPFDGKVFGDFSVKKQ